MLKTRFTPSRKAPVKSFFTLIELIAVISITSILLTITINIMKTDSTKANAQVIGGAISYAQAYAMSNSSYAIVEFTNEDGDSNGYIDTISVKSAHDSSGTITENALQKEEKLILGSHLVDSSNVLISDGFKIYISTTGEPVDSSKASEASGYSVYIKDNKSSSSDISTFIPVIMKAFTGKVTYY